MTNLLKHRNAFLIGRRFCRLFLSLLFVLALSGPADAFQFIATNAFTMTSGQVQSQETWISCEKAVINGTMNNDLFLATQEALLTGTFQGDLWTASKDIRYSGHCAGHVRFAANSLSFSGAADGNVMAAGATVEITDASHIAGEALLMGENVLFLGELNKDLTIYASRATLGGAIHGTVRVVAGDIVVMPSARIDGDIEYLSGKELFLDPSVSLGGTLKPIKLPPEKVAKQSWTDRFMYQAFFYMSALIAGLAWLFLFPTQSACAVATLRESALRCFLTGLAFLLLMPAVIALFFISLLGIPLSILLAGGYLILLYVGKFITAMAMGLLIFRRPPGQPAFQNVFTVFSSGMLCMYLPAVLPALSSFIWIIATCCGVGALLMGGLRLRNRERRLIAIAENPQPQPDAVPVPEAEEPRDE